MQSADVQKQVWQRLAAQSPLPRESGGELLPPAQQLLALYRQLGERQLYEAQEDTVSCLKGILRLAGGRLPPRSPVPPEKQSRDALLQLCYRRSRAAWTEYMARSADLQTGVVFRLLSDREAKHCAMIAALLGKL